MAARDPFSALPGQPPLGSGDAAGWSAGPRSAGPKNANRPIPLTSKNAHGLPDYYNATDGDVETDDLREILRNAPAWLVSTVFHMTLLIVLGLIAVASKVVPDDVDVAVAMQQDPLESIDEIGSQMMDPSVTEGDATRLENVGDEPVITPKDLAPVDDPLASPIHIGELQIGPGPSISGPTVIEGAPIGLALKGRQIGSKSVLLGKYGGTADTERAVELALAWLAKQQRPDGLWSLSGPYPDGCQSENNAAATAMALLAFQGHGDTHLSGKYAPVVKKAWDKLLTMQKLPSGQFAGVMHESNHLLYTHAQCTIALCELLGMTHDSRFRSAAEKAVAYCVFAQDKQQGGWRYLPGVESDTSVTGWFVMALQSAKMAGLAVPEETLNRASSYLDSAALNDGRAYGYWEKQQVSDAVTAEGLLCRQYLGWKRNDPRLVDGVTALLDRPISFDQGRDVYYWYYATQATHHMEGKIWDKWNDVMRREVPAHQVKDGPQAGSWDPHGDKWGTFGGRLYVTCMSTYVLEVYYRHLPIYSGYNALAQGSASPKLPVADVDTKTDPAADEPAAAPKGKKRAPAKSDAEN